MTRRCIKKLYERERQKLIGYLTAKDKEILPALHYALIEKDKTPNIHLVVDALDKLLVTFHGVDDEGNDFTYPSVIQDAPGDLPETKALRQEIRGSIDAKIMDNLELVHHEAALLCPPFKHIKFFEGYKNGMYCKRQEAIASLKEKLGRYGPLLNDEQENEEQEQENANSNNRAAVAPPPRKKRKISDLRFQSHRRAPNQRRAPRLAYLNELDEYLREKVIDPDKKFVHNPLEYWFQPHVELKYPTLSKIAIHILAIPAASAFVERLFSLSGWLASGKRSHMKPKTLRILCCLKKRKRNYEKEEEKK